MVRFQTLQVKDVSRVSGVSVRALHHWDQIGLLVPGRTGAGYRVYEESHLLRLQQILIGRSLGLSLEEIRVSLDDPAFDHQAALRRQRAALVDRLSETHKAIAAIDAALAHLTPQKGEKTMDAKQLFDGFDPAAHDAEVKQRWGETDAYKESAKRTRSYGEAQWREIKAEASAIWEDAAKAMAAGFAPESETARALVERHRQHVERWFYPVSPAMHLKLADMWEGDERFTASIDRHGEGLTAWIAAAVRAA